MVEQAHRQTLHRLENEKRNHSDFMRKSDEFTSLLEQERERSVSIGYLYSPSVSRCLM